MVSKENLKPILILAGPTATGKSELALELAEASPEIEIVNADSLLVYREMDIGTAKPTPSELKKVPHHLINIRNPDELFTAGEFFRAAQSAIQEIHQRNRRALIVGGTGFYLKALLFGLWNVPPSDAGIKKELEKWENEKLSLELKQIDPLAAQRIGTTDRYRLIRSLELCRLTGKTPTALQSEHSTSADPRFRLWIVDRAQDELLKRIQNRTLQMLQSGLIEEVAFLRARYPKSRALLSVGYAQTCDFLDQKTPKGRKISPGIEGLNQEIQLATRQLVKQQRTWFKSQSAHTAQSRWYELDRDLPTLKLEFNLLYREKRVHKI